MVDLLSDLGFVDSKKAARDLMNNLVSSTDDLNKVADNIKRRVEDQQREDAYSKADECVMADKKPGEHLAQLLNDYGFVVDEDSANKLVAALEATDQDLNRILFHFIHGPSKPVNDKPLPTPEERQAMDDAAAMRGVKEEVKEYEQKQKKAGKKLQAAEPRWGWAGPKHPRDPKADKIDLLG
ncbi:hypothetical protein Pmar_PMAR005700 [Perkinsus marinus ATCC 50983]|uniref:Uncharacterized protein n=2 Tax=Perkinsus marinus (strain ATCC 50983 / TXsc) TaxID=423536 RepID=C5KY73_PERM5|nr:hypothetical protein Pmar_PMAR005700 [Perkinsus marinus ATCC 50983]EER10570.1 hypothetical protein Pmar_PMAR005700 [Perkinsus marinus ATCC 50983]|eukprot:XP_002778775.1 hypothetical protein Pmar_PMAR005700 [Perkinsus marinus ATCC 50983]